ncbi:hypothetical protein PLICRDRAFT_627202 [Plicaturopsis crispa FD-325 SS-3]|nr:hypothetical protein PLICRDRAFT_627202 [Plicaturopsis crispa FD-325 SS-3]
MRACDNGWCLHEGTRPCGGGCKMKSFCSESCQEAAWPSHKEECITRVLGAVAGKKNRDSEGKPATSNCTGCNAKFVASGEYRYVAASTCPDCGYVACESCVCHETKGTCYCQNSNFGHPYCGREPRWYHMSSRTRKPYKGDRHPEGRDYRDEIFEAQPRECGNCHKIARCLKKEYLLHTEDSPSSLRRPVLICVAIAFAAYWYFR